MMACAPRGLLPYRTYFFVLGAASSWSGCVAITTEIAYRRTSFAIGICRTSFASDRIRSPSKIASTDGFDASVVRSRIVSMSEKDGNFTSSLKKNRSSCASGQRVRAFHLERVLRRQHEERVRQLIRLPADGDVLLLHCFEQRRLRLRRRPVDFVRQHDVPEDRAALELELPAAVVRVQDDVRADQVRGHEVRGEAAPG